MVACRSWEAGSVSQSLYLAGVIPKLGKASYVIPISTQSFSQILHISCGLDLLSGLARRPFDVADASHPTWNLGVPGVSMTLKI